MRQRKIHHGIGIAREYQLTYAVASRTTSGPPRRQTAFGRGVGERCGMQGLARTRKHFGRWITVKLHLVNRRLAFPLGVCVGC